MAFWSPGGWTRSYSRGGDNDGSFVPGLSNRWDLKYLGGADGVGEVDGSVESPSMVANARDIYVIVVQHVGGAIVLDGA